MRARAVPAGVASVLAASPAAWAGTCALCRQALESGGSRGLIQGFYLSILLIGAMPLLVAGVILMRVHRARAARRRAA
jgi:hypothetical protein